MSDTVVVVLVVVGVLVMAAAILVPMWLNRRGEDDDPPGALGGLIRSRDFFLGKGEQGPVEPKLDRFDDEELDVDPTDGFRFDDNQRDIFEPAQEPVAEAGNDAPDAAYFDEGDGEYRRADDDARQIDFWVRIPGSDPVSRDAVLAIYRQQEYMLEHPHGIHGRNSATGAWSNLEKEPESANFTDLVLTIQLCDRSGPVSESELTRFSNLVFTLAESLDRAFKFQGTVEEALEQAQRVHRFCQRNDVFAIINICGEGDRRFRGPEVLRAVEGCGMRYGDMKIFHGPESAGGEPLYSLANMVKPGVFDLEKIKEFSTPGLTMFMSVPRSGNPGEVFSKMAYTARKIANLLGGVLHDQGREPLDDNAIKQLRRQVDDMAAEMSEKGVRPGSEEALRLF